MLILLLLLVAAQVPGPVRLSRDAPEDPVVRRCLANPAGMIPRATDDEPYLAVDPRNPRRAIAVWQTRSGSGSVIQWVRSSDGGRTWTVPRAAPINACAGGPLPNASHASDPWATFGPDGRAYLSAISWTPNPNDGPDLVSALIVVASPDGGNTWHAPVPAAIAPDSSIAHDNLAITADPTRPGTVYAATTRAEQPDSVTYFGRLGFTRSDDGGRSWTPIRPITPALNHERIGAPQIVVDPRSGRLYAVYHRRTGGTGTVAVMRSDDRGDTWAAESAAAPHVAGERPAAPGTSHRFVLADDILQAAISPRTGYLILAYSDGRRAPGRRHDVSVVWSPDGLRWSAPLAVSDSGSETAWLPAIAATTDGVIGVTYFSADFTSNAPRASIWLKRYRQNADALVPLDPVLLDQADLAWPGDYHGLAAIGTGLLAVYGKERDIWARRH